MALLYVVESADFTFVMNQTGLTWGNLSAHLNKLDEAGYLQVEKSFIGRRPNTSLRLTDSGRQAFRTYRQSLMQAMERSAGVGLKSDPLRVIQTLRSFR